MNSFKSYTSFTAKEDNCFPKVSNPPDTVANNSLKKNLFHAPSAGYLATHHNRVAQGKKSNNEADKLAKEHRMGVSFARNGFQMKLIQEPANRAHYDALLNGTPAEMKSLKGHNHIVREAKEAVRKKGAKIVLFEFAQETDAIYLEIEKLKKRDIQGDTTTSKKGGRIYIPSIYGTTHKQRVEHVVQGFHG